MENIVLAAEMRTEIGSREARKIRRSGKVPATLYGHGMKPLSLQIGTRDLMHILHTKAGENVVINLRVEGKKLKESTCLLKEIQYNPVTDKINHLDLTVISLTEKIDVKVPLVTVNADGAAGVKEGGVLDVIHHEIEIQCMPTAIPERIEVDVEAMNIGDSIHIKDLPIPEGVVCKLEPEEVIVALHAPAKEEEEVPAEEGEAAEPEVIEKGKKDEEAEGDVAEGAPKKAEKGAEKAEKKGKPEKKE